MANLFSQPFVLLSTMNVRMSQWKISSLPQEPPAGEGGRELGTSGLWWLRLGWRGLGLRLSARRLNEAPPGAAWPPDSTAVASESQVPGEPRGQPGTRVALPLQSPSIPLRGLRSEGGGAGLPDSTGGHRASVAGGDGPPHRAEGAWERGLL